MKAPLAAWCLTAALCACNDVEAPAQSSGASSGTGAASAGWQCPAVDDTWPMVAVERGDGSAFCIDSREATNEQYAKALDRNVPVELHPKCAESPDRTPKANWPVPADRMRYPVVAVNWCDAQAFCSASGKRLCGDAVSGSVIEISDADMAYEVLDVRLPTEMQTACTRGGAQLHAYGNEYQEGICSYAPVDATVSADSSTECEGGHEGIFFLEGNVLEWEARCKFDASQEGLAPAFCTTRGIFECDLYAFDTDNGVGVTEWAPYVGIRCCADAVPVN